MQAPPGTYACLKLDEESQLKIGRFIARNNIVNGLSVSDLHATIIYSKVHCPKMVGMDVDITAKIKSIVSIPSDGKICLAFDLDCPEMHKLHKDLREEHGAAHGFDEYISHITFTYDYVGSHWPRGLREIGPITFNRLHVEDLNPDWTTG